MLTKIIKMCGSSVIRASGFSCLRIRTEKMATNENQSIHTENHPSVSSVVKQLAKTMGIERGYRRLPKTRDHLQKLIPTKREQLPPRTMRDSYTVAAIPLATNDDLQELMVSITGFVRLNKLLEDMDIFAVAVAQNYIKNPLVGPKDHSPYTIVTALVNKIDFSDYHPKVNSDIRISGHVTWVGTSSIEVLVWLDQKEGGAYKRITKALFLLVVRDAINSKAALINPLKTTTPQEEELAKAGEIRKKLRIKLKMQDLKRSVPSAEEQKLIHDKFQKTIVEAEISLNQIKLPPGSIWMEECEFSNIILIHPENRNLHNTVFGGFLMRKAADLSYSLVRIFGRRRPLLRCIDDINFSKPVLMNMILIMSAYIVYTEGVYVQVIVYAQTYDILTNTKTTTNSFHFTYEVDELVKEVFPKTYDETMMYIDGVRHFRQFLQSNQGDHPFDFEPINFGIDEQAKINTNPPQSKL
ncbi:acyl-coenzyme A thioesterase 9, mitochondrial-like [Onthophagus taurus]|uniref:acyl-coenzyme A thioesterase 9, mitochondrial-like n=1 Tax=Onthophagus taurus TaxID=166361 RepID=UPI000C2004CD|nr:acyl-coenzyme A thioesterase 9, mitochondrial-like [Onthophagus taurus]